tara:strand:+ start:458 stop:1087 length:630 start_codon:yes stop_codon:yes gene_type:complete
MKKNINIFKNFGLILMIVISGSCKEVKNFFLNKENTSTNIPTDNEIIKALHGEISKKHFEIALLSKKLKSLSTINIKRDKFEKGSIIQSSHKETCQGLHIDLVQKTKKNCSLKISQSKKEVPYTHCLKSIKTSSTNCKKWVRPLFFAKYCQKSSVKRRDKDRIFLNLPKDHSFKTSLKIELCQIEGENNYSLRQFKLNGEALPLHVQKI